MAGKLIFISGGARSGKSQFAEKYAKILAKKHDKTLTYIATSKIEDDEMAERVNRHQKDRAESQLKWRTIEQPSNIGTLAKELKSDTLVLLDCVTILIANELFQGNFDLKEFEDQAYQDKIIENILKGIKDIAAIVDKMIVVSNEVLFDIFDPQTESVTYIYQKIIGSIHQQLVQLADESYLVEFGMAERMDEVAI